MKRLVSAAYFGMCVLASSLQAQAQAPSAPAAPALAAKGRKAQDDEAVHALDLRVLGLQAAGLVKVDRGERDLVQVGDRVVFRPLGRPQVEGRVSQVDARTSLVKLELTEGELEAGVPGVVLVPSSRFQPTQPKPAPGASPGLKPPLNDASAFHGPRRPPVRWTNRDDGYRKGMPLLSTAENLTPEQRPMRMVGRVSVLANAGRSSLDDRTDAFVRLGADVELENPFGRGGRLHVDGEVNHRRTDVDGQVDEQFSKARLDRASYAWGGTRWEPVRQEVGRFLQPVVPEFGVLDGWSWSTREDDGTRMGGSVGFLPEPNISLSTGKDLAASGFYRWASDDSERFATTVGVQKTWHHGKRDRDLILAKVQIVPEEGWSVHASAWVDYYSDSDDAKDSGFELTEAHASATRRFDDVAEVTLAFDHRRFPELLREEFAPVALNQLADDRYDRLSARGRRQLEEGVDILAEVGAWNDEDESGGDAELGMEWSDLLARGSRSSASVWLAEGRFSRSSGARVAYGMPFQPLTFGSGSASTGERSGQRSGQASGRWDVSYEVSQHENAGFNVDFARVVQHWVRLSWGFHLADGWRGTVSADARLWDDADEDAQSVHLSLTKSF